MLPGILYFPSSRNNYVQPISRVHDSTRCSSLRLQVFVSKSSVVLRGSRNTEPSFSELPLFLRLPSSSLKENSAEQKKQGATQVTTRAVRLPGYVYPSKLKRQQKGRFDATTEWVARCQLLSAINRIRSLFPLFAQPLSLSVRVLPTLLLLLLSLTFLSNVQDTSSLFSSLTLINIWLNWIRRLVFLCVVSRQASLLAPQTETLAPHCTAEPSLCCVFLLLWCWMNCAMVTLFPPVANWYHWYRCESAFIH